MMVGETLSHYRVLRSVGGGGMGEVYEAEDLRLGRHVALKVISASYKHSPAAFQRFEREARAASSLNHPNICTIFDLLEHEGQPVIVMELLDGQSLARRMKDGPIDPPSFLRLSQQIADGLDAAHRAGVVHRDITPGNIFVTAEGQVKLLDFGLAKLTAKSDSGEGHSQSGTHVSDDATLTGAGQVVGTVAYMSPEQVRGEGLDHRTDLFSCGTVLYEMATGRRPFDGRTSAMVCDAILHADPAPVTRTNSRVPAGLEPIIGKALEKDRNRRYQSASDLKADLLRLDRSTGAVEAVSWRPAIRWRWVLPVGVVLGLALVGLMARWGVVGRGPINARSRPLTDGAGVEAQPAISPDGRLIAYTSDESGSRDIWILDLQTQRSRRLTTGVANEDGPAWFPDGKSVVFESDADAEGPPGVWRVGLDGRSSPTLLLRDARSPSVSPDGTRIAFGRLRHEGFSRIAVAPLADPSRVLFLSEKEDGLWDHTQPTWSPDGAWVCYQAMDGIWIAAADGRDKPRRLNTQPLTGTDPAWSADGKTVYYSAYTSGLYALWRLPFSGGDPTRVTVGSGRERSPSVSRDGSKLAFSTETSSRHLQFINLDTREMKVWEPTSRDDWYPAIAQDRSAVYFISDRSGSLGIWRQPLAADTPVGSAVQVVKQDGNVSYPDLSPDGRWLVYTLMVGTERQLWVAPSEPGRGAPTRISGTDIRGVHPAWSPDSRRIAFAAENDDEQQICIQAVVDGRPVGRASPITTTPGYKRWPSWIDDSRVAYVARGSAGLGEVVIADLSHRTPPRVATLGINVLRVRWRPRSETLFVAGWGDARVLTLGLLATRLDDRTATARLVPVLPLGTDLISAFFDVSADGRLAVTTKVSGTGDLWILEAQGRQRF